MEDKKKSFKLFTKNSDLVIGISVLMILSVMIIPISPWVLDLLLSFTLSFSIIVLLISIYAKKNFRLLNLPIGIAGSNIT